MSTDSIYTELKVLEEQRRGISPKLELYTKITEKIEALKKQVGGQGEAFTHQQKRPSALYPKVARYN